MTTRSDCSRRRTSEPGPVLRCRASVPNPLASGSADPFPLVRTRRSGARYPRLGPLASGGGGKGSQCFPSSESRGRAPGAHDRPTSGTRWPSTRGPRLVGCVPYRYQPPVPSVTTPVPGITQPGPATGTRTGYGRGTRRVPSGGAVPGAVRCRPWVPSPRMTAPFRHPDGTRSGTQGRHPRVSAGPSVDRPEASGSTSALTPH